MRRSKAKSPRFWSRTAMRRCAGAPAGATGTGGVYTVEMAYFLKWRGDTVAELHEFLDYPGPLAIGREKLSSYEEMLRRGRRIGPRGNRQARQRAGQFRAVAGPDIELIRKYYSPDIVCEFVGHRARIPMPAARGRRSRDQYRARHQCRFRTTQQRALDILVDDGRLACRRTVSGVIAARPRAWSNSRNSSDSRMD